VRIMDAMMGFYIYQKVWQRGMYNLSTEKAEKGINLNSKSIPQTGRPSRRKERFWIEKLESIQTMRGMRGNLTRGPLLLRRDNAPSVY